MISFLVMDAEGRAEVRAEAEAACRLRGNQEG
jgi:hypothetical protein